MTGRSTQVQLSIEIDSEPISGSLSVDAGAPQQFCGWIELVAALESVRGAALPVAGESLGSLPGAKRSAI
jgi:hypothetical protein